MVGARGGGVPGWLASESIGLIQAVGGCHEWGGVEMNRCCAPLPTKSNNLVYKGSRNPVATEIGVNPQEAEPDLRTWRVKNVPSAVVIEHKDSPGHAAA